MHPDENSQGLGIKRLCQDDKCYLKPTDRMIAGDDREWRANTVLQNRDNATKTGAEQAWHTVNNVNNILKFKGKQ